MLIDVYFTKSYFLNTPSIHPISSPSHRVFFHLGTCTCLLTDLSALKFSVTDPPHGSLSHPSKPPSLLTTFPHETFSRLPWSYQDKAYTMQCGI